MAANDYEELLTPYQRIREANQLGERALAAQTAFDATRAVNPLTRERELTPAVPVEEPAPAGVAAPPQPNPFIRPSLPLSTMPLAQQLAWQDREDKTKAAQAALSEQLLATDVKRKEQEIKQKQTDQGRLMIAEMDTLDPSKDDYLTQKAALARKYPAGAGSVEVDRAFGHLDAQHAKLLEHQGKAATAEEARKATFEQKRLEAGYKVAEKLGPVVQREYAALMAKDPDAANNLLAQRQREDITASLLAGGLTQQAIEQKYGAGEQFKVAAAQQAAKGSLQERREASREYAFWDKKKKDAADIGQVLDPGDEAAWQTARDYMVSITPTLGGDRAGVVGMPVQVSAPDSASWGYKPPVTPAVVATPQVVTRPGAAPAAAPVVKEKIIYNPKTGERQVLRNGAWVTLR